MITLPAIDPNLFKDAVRSQWNASAQGWNHHTPQIRAWLKATTDTMLEMAGITVDRQALSRLARMIA